MSTEYRENAARYALRPVAGTDSLAFRMLEERIRALDLSGTALDVGCGAGRSTRFLRSLGFQTTGLDVDVSMLHTARELDSGGEYHLYDRDAQFPFEDRTFDVVLSTWTVLEIGSREALQHFMSESKRVLRTEGVGFVVTNTPEFYVHRWVSCDVDFPENTPPLRSGQRVAARLVPEGVVVEDTFWSDADYRQTIEAAGLQVMEAHLPVASRSEEGWLDETEVAPYVVYEVREPDACG
jgi:SAM-dependent methyltransferase